jgi:hypothetical protein
MSNYKSSTQYNEREIQLQDENLYIVKFWLTHDYELHSGKEFDEIDIEKILFNGEEVFNHEIKKEIEKELLNIFYGKS